MHANTAPGSHKLAAPDWLWSEDRQLKQTVFAEIQAVTGRTFTLDAATLDDDSNAKCTELYIPSNSFLDKDHAGNIWINEPFSKLLSFVEHCQHANSLHLLTHLVAF